MSQGEKSPCQEAAEVVGRISHRTFDRRPEFDDCVQPNVKAYLCLTYATLRYLTELTYSP